MEASTFLKDFSNVGLGVMIFVMWIYENRKRDQDGKTIDTLRTIVDQQFEDKKVLRDERVEFVKLLESHAKVIGRAMSLLDRMEDRWGRVVESKV